MGEVHEDLRRKRLAELRVEHRDLDDVITKLMEGPYVDQLQVRRLKKRKL
ncbi:MAG: YdcH family protein, partial [Gammaproteobacteria bacterium]|nr:YdcH family protein [Gammaproteobacteria bacterium]